MIKKFSEKEFESSSPSDLLPFECYCCQKKFYIRKSWVTFYNKNKSSKRNPICFCSRNCSRQFRVKKIEFNCCNCNKTLHRVPSEINHKRKKSSRNFCSRSCAATYNNTHKTTGNRRSKLEIWIESKLTELYPDLHIDYNKSNAIDSELDIYISSLKLAIELNGIFHYEPIYGEHKLEQIQNNDHRKHQACYERNIEILSIDTSSFNHFKEHNAQKYLNIIIDIVEQRLSNN
jgi:hypothetical protein